MMFKFDHTPYTKKENVKLAITSFTISIVFGANYKFVEPQNDPTFGEHADKALTLLCAKYYPYSSIYPHP
jgi:hypothetical protein